MIVSFVIMILLLLLFTTIEGPAETLVTVAFLTFFFVYLLRLLNVINKPFKVGSERNDDDVSSVPAVRVRCACASRGR